ncbi:Uncharacterised protein [Mycobacterium tuberculosis]|nr:Uncharacterised protein [Mycobacterium tuberculosis]
MPATMAPSTVNTMRLRIATTAANAMTCGSPTSSDSGMAPSVKLRTNSSALDMTLVACSTRKIRKKDTMVTTARATAPRKESFTADQKST